MSWWAPLVRSQWGLGSSRNRFSVAHQGFFRPGRWLVGGVWSYFMALLSGWDVFTRNITYCILRIYRTLVIRVIIFLKLARYEYIKLGWGACDFESLECVTCCSSTRLEEIWRGWNLVRDNCMAAEFFMSAPFSLDTTLLTRKTEFIALKLGPAALYGRV